jgi:hypothetical protein
MIELGTRCFATALVGLNKRTLFIEAIVYFCSRFVYIFVVSLPNKR